MKQKKIFVPTKDAESWRDLLADKNKHWRKDFSAMETALSWENSENIPTEIHNVISEKSDFTNLELLLVLPEYKVDLPGGTRPSQNDILAVFTTNKSLTVMTVEGKAKEDFDKIISKWKESTSDNGVEKRLGFILEKIGIKDKNIDSLRYQLFHRLASAVIVSEKFHAKNAIMIIQSFNNNNEENHFDDYVNFIKLYDIASVEKSKLYKLTEINGINVFSAWVYSKCAINKTR
jgi:hypothetical protein